MEKKDPNGTIKLLSSEQIEGIYHRIKENGGELFMHYFRQMVGAASMQSGAEGAGIWHQEKEYWQVLFTNSRIGSLWNLAVLQ